MSDIRLLDNPELHHHFVQLYTDEVSLARNVGRYLSQGVNNGEAGIVIATPEHREAFLSNLRGRDIDVDALEKSRKLLFLDARRTLSHCLVKNRPDWSRFESTITNAVSSL